MRRTRLIDYRLSAAPILALLCQGDQPAVAAICNEAQERLLYDPKNSEQGPNGTWAEMVFSVDKYQPYITCPRGVARIEAIDVCDHPIQLNNQFYEYLQFGNGRMPKHQRWGRWANCLTQGYTRNNAITFVDLQNEPQQIQIVATNPLDAQPNSSGFTPRVLMGGIGENGGNIWTQDGNTTVQGEFVTVGSTSVNSFSYLTGIQKDVTLGDIQIWQTDPIWGSAELLLTMEPTETTANYRRYYLNGLPCGCCNHNRFFLPKKSPTECGCPYPRKEWVYVTALVKLDLVPAIADPDYLLIQNLAALIRETQAIRYSRVDDGDGAALEASNHEQAMRLLKGESIHFNGKNEIAVNYAPFGSARLERVRINMR